MPPARAIAMAISASVTVSIAAGNQRNVERDLSGETTRDRDLPRVNCGVPGDQQNVVEGESARPGRMVLMPYTFRNGSGVPSLSLEAGYGVESR